LVVQSLPVRADAVRLERVYEEEGARLWRAVYLYAADREVASDAVAEAFAQALRRGNELRSPERWVWRRAFRIAAGELKRRRNEHGLWTDASYEIPDATAELLAALPRISPKQRAAIVLHYHAGYSLNEVADIIGSTPAAVGVHLHRGGSARAMIDGGHPWFAEMAGQHWSFRELRTSHWPMFSAAAGLADALDG
jgi:RNA polymerase sigma factor (sigma-70 family)